MLPFFSPSPSFSEFLFYFDERMLSVFFDPTSMNASLVPHMMPTMMKAKNE